MIRAEDPAHHTHRPHIQGHVLDGNGLIHKGLAEDGFPAGGCGGRLGLVRFWGGLGGSGYLPYQVPAHILHLPVKGLAIQLRTGDDLQGDASAEPVEKIPAHAGDAGLQLLFAVGSQGDGELVPLPVPPGPGQTGPGAGVQRHKLQQQLLGLHLLQGFRREMGVKLHPAHIVQAHQVIGGLVQQPGGDIPGTLQLQQNGPVLQIQLRVLDDAFPQQTVQRLRRAILRKHL